MPQALLLIDVRKILLILALALGGGVARAEWIKIAHNEQSVFYLDSSTSKKVEGRVMIWVLREHAGLRFGGNGAYQSSKDQFDVDCFGRRIRRIYSSDHPKSMGEGKAVNFEHGPMSWNYAAPNTIVGRIVDVACARP